MKYDNDDNSIQSQSSPSLTYEPNMNAVKNDDAALENEVVAEEALSSKNLEATEAKIILK